MDISILVRHHEASGDPGSVSTGAGDLGGVSYGIYQLSSTSGSVASFVTFCQNYANADLANYGNVLAQYEVNSDEFINQWRSIASADSLGFSELQDNYAEQVYLNPAIDDLRENLYDVDKHSDAIRAVIFSRAVQYSSGNVVELFNEAVARLNYPNLSYVDDVKYDAALIEQIYAFLVDECDQATWNGSIYHSPKDWCNGSADVIAGLRNRFVNEGSEAVELVNEA